MIDVVHGAHSPRGLTSPPVICISYTNDRENIWLEGP
ncbi:uncharacterized protein METZ01_LOCUS322501, partial [marine metagenome]